MYTHMHTYLHNRQADGFEAYIGENRGPGTEP